MSDNKKERLNFILPKGKADLLEKLSVAKRQSKTKTLLSAIELYKRLVEAEEAGGGLFEKDKDGNSVRLILL